MRASANLRHPRLHVRVLGLWILMAIRFPGFSQPNAAPDFSREVQPILAQHCLSCHGLDEDARKAKLRLDRFEDAVRVDPSGEAAIVPGDPDKSMLMDRVTHPDPEEVMPPPEHGPSLKPGEIDILRRWISAGAAYEKHWSFRPLTAPVIDASGPAHPVDALLANTGGPPGDSTPQADPVTLVRRLALDLTGLPPSLEQADRYAAHPTKETYLQLVDEFLSSPRLGEHWAALWLDLARYADTKGYEKDKPRDIWAYRDWVIQAFNQDMPYDRFTREQLAGDLLPDPSPDQLVATAFHRNTLVNEEGGTDDEEYRVAAVKDRVDTTLQVWMGLTMGCAKCHSHKYDPISLREYYSFYALFNQTEDADRGDDAPVYRVWPREDREAQESLLARKEGLEKEIATHQPSDADLITFSEQEASDGGWTILKPGSVSSSGGATLEIQESGSVLAGGTAPEKEVTTVVGSLPSGTYRSLRLDALTHPSLGNRHGPGRNPADPNFVLSELTLERLGPEGSAPEVLSIASARADYEQKNWPVKKAWDENPATGWAVSPRFQEDHVAWFQLKKPLQMREGDQLRIVMNQNYGNRLVLGHFRWAASTSPPAQTSFDQARAASFAGLLSGTLEPHRRKSLTTLFQSGSPELASKRRQLKETENELAELEKRSTTVPVMREKPADKLRETRVHQRGNFLAPGEVVIPGLPEAFGTFPAGSPTNRLGVADWILDASNPLTARVAVNRVWARIFGVGLVETEEDFGAQGMPPSHPELLDWLAHQYQTDLEWSLKRLLRVLVTSQAYQLSSAISPPAFEADPANRNLLRGSRFRLSAEVIRDQALAAVGLLSAKQGGPSVMPPQPEGIWKTTYSNLKWNTSPGEDQHRRSLYTYIKRTSPYPSLLTFDAGSREVCLVRRVRTNTPLQALVTLNDPVFLEAAGTLAQSMMGPEGPDFHLAFRKVLIRPPRKEELDRLNAYFSDCLSDFSQDPEAVKALTASAGLEEATSTPELAAAISTANVILNLDELFMRP